MKKAFSAVIATALVLLTLAIGVVSASLDKIVKSAVESAGSRVLGAPVTVNGVSVSPWSGRGILRGLVIGNPTGFKSPYAASVAEVEVEVKLSSLLTNTVVVERVAVREPELNWELGPKGSNFKTLQRNAETSEGKSEESPKKDKSLFVGDFTVAGGKVGVSATKLGGRGLTVALPDVHLTNLGGEGRSPSDAAAQAVRAITTSAQGAVANVGGKTLDQVRTALGALFKRNGK